MMTLLVASSLMRGRVWWEIPNLLGSTFYGSRAFWSGPGLATIAGLALQLTMTGVLGALFGLASKIGLVSGGALSAAGEAPRRLRLVLLGTLAGICWYYAANALLWNRINPLVPVYLPVPATIFSHALFGACLGYISLAV